MSKINRMIKKRGDFLRMTIRGTLVEGKGDYRGGHLMTGKGALEQKTATLEKFSRKRGEV